ncbi:sigma factor-like helix-turn-helix DNA-binding protein [Priestia megaterium]
MGGCIPGKKPVAKQSTFTWTHAKNQKLLNLFYKENFSQKDIAKIMGCSYNALRKQLYRLRKKQETGEAI